MKSRNLLLILICCSFSQLAFACDDKDVVGKWIETLSPDQNCGYVFKENYQFITLHKGEAMGTGGDGYKSTWTIDCSHTPAHLTMTMMDKHGKTTALKAIFMKESNDHLVIRHAYDGVRPSTFDNMASDQTEFRRAR